ncbi:MAG TPA: hypothetical protein VEP28_13240 [Rubrobacter sp.]|nr:hypothetical protein [Rubrobacter sp.]
MRVLPGHDLRPQPDGLADAVLREPVLADSGHGIAISLGRTCLVSGSGRENLSARPLDLIAV